MMRNKNAGKAITVAGIFALGLAAMPHGAVAGEGTEKSGSVSEQGKKDRKAGEKSNSSAAKKSGAGDHNAAPDEWEKAQGKTGQEKGGSTGGDTGMGSSSSQGSSTSGTSSGSGGY